MNKFLPHGRKPTKADLHKCAAFSPVVHQCLMMHERGDLDETEALTAAILALAEQNEHLLRQTAELSMKQNTVYIKATGNS